MKLIERIKEIDPWYALFWLGLFVIFVWAVLKSVGVIQSPIWQEMIPVFSAVASAVGIAKYIVKYIVKIAILELKVDRLENDMKEVKDVRLIKIEKHLRILG